MFCWPNNWFMNGENWLIDNENSPPACQALSHRGTKTLFFIFEGSKTNQNVLNKATFLVFYTTSLGFFPQTKSILYNEDLQAWNCDYLLTKNRHVHRKARSRTYKWHHWQHRDVDWGTFILFEIKMTSMHSPDFPAPWLPSRASLMSFMPALCQVLGRLSGCSSVLCLDSVLASAH